MTNRPAWMEHAECRHSSYFDSWPQDLQLAYCNACPVTAECLTHGLRESSAHSGHNIIHGGKTPTELARMVAQQRRKTT